MKHWIMNRAGLAVLLALVVNTAYTQFSKEEVKQSAWEEYFTGKLINVALWPDGMPNDNGIDYANLPESSWDMMPQLVVSLPPKGDKPTRAVVICPGGGYAFTCPRESDPPALQFFADGFQVFILYYTY